MPFYRDPYLSIYEKHLKTANKSEVIEFIQNFGSVFAASGEKRKNGETLIKQKSKETVVFYTSPQRVS